MPEIDAEALRPLLLLVPTVVAGGLWIAVTDPVRRGAATLALLWNLVGLTAVNAAALAVGWWGFGDPGPAIVGVPIDLLVAWALLWSVIPVLAAKWIPIAYLVVGLVLLDLYAMPALEPVVGLRGDWWWGEAVAVAACLVPGVVLADLTVRRKHLPVRVALQVVLFTAVLFVAVPVLARAAAEHGPLVDRMTGWDPSVGGFLDAVTIQLAGVVAIVALAAVVEFYRAGGTPWPWDPPTRLVAAGPYAYVANPMQLAGTVLVVAIAVVLSMPILLVAAAVVASFSAGLAAWVENDALAVRFGAQWSDYRKSVRAWVPRWRPIASAEPARAYLARGCDPCSELAAWIVKRNPVGLLVEDAENYRADATGELWRMRYERADGLRLDGIRALGAVLVHLNLAWAIAGWVVATPGISHVLQILVDACGGGPRRVVRDDRPGNRVKNRLAP
ncbi:hypothetical protein GOARA_063_00120 [Gordonia araii NBRC 100433]|uniref:Phospholipid methyltransferase n=1 Tax=Gordonia araii NBRC 100433 TaxID=1073574 RepID=G7H4N8_9ACTN|nr:methyltransferase [Gordonia araii]NNG98045.1 hypothetical protein [Gordonia araii NBRC 100433]GAB10813.1 hypothetical protein GOARA_063_00120 [Gordonia araii NBRC 100433]